MNEQEKKQRIAELRAELKELEATPRSDWHAGFEAVLRIEIHKYGDLVHMDYSQYSGHELRGKIYLPHRLLNKTDQRIETLSRQVKACH